MSGYLIFNIFVLHCFDILEQRRNTIKLSCSSSRWSPTNQWSVCFFILVWHWPVSSEGVKSCPLWSQWRGHQAPPGAGLLALQEYPQSSAFRHLGDEVSGPSSWYWSYPWCHSAEAQKCSLPRERCWLASWCWCWSCVMAQLTSRGERYHESQSTVWTHCTLLFQDFKKTTYLTGQCAVLTHCVCFVKSINNHLLVYWLSILYVLQTGGKVALI